ncbi:hypothetical protein [Streptomyces sp. BRA346]|uniref:hypothetical protein n=1 Tax=Streptomyces sp. BRA346 TaxID=2878199 RepID=UPI004064318C
MAALRAAQEKKRDEIRAKNAISRAKALAEATEAEQAARATQFGRLREGRHPLPTRHRPGLAKLADDHGVTATVDFSTGDPRYAGGVLRVPINHPHSSGCVLVLVERSAESVSSVDFRVGELGLIGDGCG